jgi:undecaprenyl-diphosphatase
LNWFESIILGIVQGLTEFLPVSSSGHLVLFQTLFGLTEPALLFDVCLHVGTLLAVAAVFSRELGALLSVVFRSPAMIRSAGGVSRLYADDSQFRLLVLIVVGSIPTAAIGFLFAKMAEQLFSTVWLVGIALLITATFLWFTRRKTQLGRPLRQMDMRDALVIGVAQGLAIIPGISRSGATISAALYLGLDRDLAGRFSFLLAIPAILGALILGLDKEAFHTTIPLTVILTGSFCAALVGYLALRMLLQLVHKGHLYRFAPYCWTIGAIALLVSIF